MADKPLVFISHKHSDREIAETIGRFLRNRTAGNVRVHLSSSPDFEGPRFGQPLNDELKRALAGAQLVILVFTTDAEDWSYCMWECGIATNPADEQQTSVVVVQCGADKPKPYGDQLRVDARDLDSVQGFVKALLTGPDLFAHRDEPVTGFSPEGTEVKEFAAALHASLADVLPAGRGAGQSRPTSPYLRIRLDDNAAEELRASYLANGGNDSLELLASHGRIVGSVAADSLFGMHLNVDLTIGDLLSGWRDEHSPDEKPEWYAALAEQIEAALVGKLRSVKWAPYRTMKGHADIPYVAASRPVADGVEFDVYIISVAPRPTPVKETMIPIGQAFCINLGETPLNEIVLVDLVGEMKNRNVTRLPVLDGRKPVSIVHKATINEFVVDAMTGGDVTNLTLDDLLTQRAAQLEGSFVDVSPETTLEKAAEAMRSRAGCQDVYVTHDGKVIGWLTNVMFIRDQAPIS